MAKKKTAAPVRPEGVNVIPWKGHPDRWLGKFKHLDGAKIGKWDRIPGGAAPASCKTRDQALEWAAQWLASYRAKVQASAPAPAATWGAICDAYIAEIEATNGLALATRHEAKTITNAHLRDPIFERCAPGEIDEQRCIDWLRAKASESIAADDEPTQTRKPRTIRNIAKHLPDVFKIAKRRKLLPAAMINPADGDGFKEEIARIMKGASTEVVSLPIESFAKLVTCEAIPWARRVLYLSLGLTGARPGEIHGLKIEHWETSDGIEALAIEQQFALSRGKVKAAEGRTKTDWAKRKIPIHRALLPALRSWREDGWRELVGRDPKAGDFLFPDAGGLPYREERADQFQADLVTAGCPTTIKGEKLRPYSLRHLFSTMLTEGEAHDAAHDRLMGHRPKDTKHLHYSAKTIAFLAKAIDCIAFDLAPEPTRGTLTIEAPETAALVSDVVSGTSQEVSKTHADSLKQVPGGVAEWSKAAVLKVATPSRTEPHHEENPERDGGSRFVQDAPKCIDRHSDRREYQARYQADYVAWLLGEHSIVERHASSQAAWIGV